LEKGRVRYVTGEMIPRQIHYIMCIGK